MIRHRPIVSSADCAEVLPASERAADRLLPRAFGAGEREHAPPWRRGRFAFQILTAFAFLGLAPDIVAAERPHRPPNVNYALFCLGCHTSEGEASPLGRIPVLKGAVGHFTRLPEGRRYVVNVPGVVNSDLAPEDTAQLLNWLVKYYAGASKPVDFVPFTGAEVEALRKDAPDDVMALRAKARALLADQGVHIDPYP